MKAPIDKVSKQQLKSLGQYLIVTSTCKHMWIPNKTPSSNELKRLLDHPKDLSLPWLAEDQIFRPQLHNTQSKDTQ